MTVLIQIFEVCLIPLLGALTTLLIAYINTKRTELKKTTDSELTTKYLDMLADTIIDCVTATNQTYVETLKKQGKFDKEAQQIAFQKTLSAVYDILSDEALDYLNEAVGDLEKYISEKIEAEVNNKK